MTIVSVDPHGFAVASETVSAVRTDICRALKALTSSLSSCGQMAGDDDAGVKWGKEYDPAALAAVKGSADLANAIQKTAEGLMNTGFNHAASEAASAGRTVPEGFDLRWHPEAQFTPPPTAHGKGNADLPEGWHFIVNLVEVMWPNGDPDKLKKAGEAWKLFAADIRSAKGRLDGALAPLEGFECPEKDGIEKVHQTLTEGCSSLAEHCSELGDACNEYAKHITDTWAESNEEIAELLRDALIAEVISGLLAAPTAGASEVIGNGALLARCAVTAQRVASLIWRLVERAEVIATRIARIVSVGERSFKVVRAVSVFVARAPFQMAQNSAISAATQVVSNGISDRPLDQNVESAAIFGALPGGKILGRAKSRFRVKDTPIDPLYGRPRADHGRTPEEFKIHGEEYPESLSSSMMKDSEGKPYGVDAREGFPLSEYEYDRRYTLPDGSPRWPGNEGALPCTRFRFTSIELFKAEFGTKFDRIGNENGKYLGRAGDNFEKRSLPAASRTGEYNAYTFRALPEGWQIEVGKVAPAFGRQGGGLQVRVLDQSGSPKSIQKLIEDGVL